MEKSVVMIAYAFPPEGAAGVFRPLRFVRYLPARGWLPYVVAAEQYSYERYDPALLNMIPAETKVTRIKGRDPWQAFQAWRAGQLKDTADASTAVRRPDTRSWRASIRSFSRDMVQLAEAWSYHPDRAMLWIRPAVEATIAICSRVKPAVIWATAGPVSSLMVAHRAGRRTGIPYVLDFRDAWTVTYNKFEARRPAWAVRNDRKNMYSLLQEAQAVTFRYQTEAECYWRAYGGALDPARIHIIPNGYEGAVRQFSVAKGEKCTILYTGTVESYRYDTLLRAVHWLKEHDPDRAKQLRLLFVGEAEELGRDAASLGVSDLISVSNPTSYAQVNILQSEAHVLLILGRPPTMKGHELFAGAKLFGYLKAGRPILGVLPSDETRKILRRVGVSTIADANSPADIAAVLQQLIDAWSKGTLNALLPDPNACEVYSAPVQTAALIRALEGRPAADPFFPGRVEIPPSLREDIDDRACICRPSFA